MANKQSFAPDEWKKLVESAMVASIAVTAAEPHGLWGTLKEGLANARGMAEGHSSSDELIRAVVADLETAEGRAIARDGMKEQFKGAVLADIPARAVATLREVGSILDTSLFFLVAGLIVAALAAMAWRLAQRNTAQGAPA